MALSGANLEDSNDDLVEEEESKEHYDDYGAQKRNYDDRDELEEKVQEQEKTI